jgi:chromosome segregation ATPase
VVLKKRLGEVNFSQEELLSLRESVSQDEEIVRQWEERANDLTETVIALQQQIKELQTHFEEQEKEAFAAISQWQETSCNLEEKCANLEAELTHVSETIASRDWTIEQLKSRNEHYHLQIEELKAEMNVKPAIETDLVEATTELSRLTEQLELERQMRIDDREQLEAELAGERGRHAEARDEIESLSTALDEIKAESEDVVNQWNGTSL